MVRADPSVVEQILFNLVDNACKYAASASDRSIQLGAWAGKWGWRHSGVRRRAGDQRGVTSGGSSGRSASRQARRRNSAPGVGLGLAMLSRRLAREMGGDLCLEMGGARGVLRADVASNERGLTVRT